MTGKREGRRGVKVVRKRLADGTIKTYRYDPAEKAERERLERERNGLRMLAVAYCKSPEFTALSPAWRSATVYYLGIIEDRVGFMTLPEVNDRRARNEFYALRDEFALTPAKADKIMNVLRRVLSWGYERGTIDVNHAVKIPHLVPHSHSRRDYVWTHENEAAFIAAATPEVRNLFRFALFTGLRQSDICGVRWADFDGEWLVIKPAKTAQSTAVSVHLPVHALPPFAEMVAGLSRSSEFMLTTDHAGQPWTVENVKKLWRRTMAAADLAGTELRFHDIRGTTVTRLFDAGCSEAEVASISGHAIGAGTMLRSYAARTRTLALNAYRKWWQAMQGGTIVHIGKPERKPETA